MDKESQQQLLSDLFDLLNAKMIKNEEKKFIKLHQKEFAEIKRQISETDYNFENILDKILSLYSQLNNQQKK